MKKQYIIIGASAAGISAYTMLSKLDPEANITCITQDIYKPYNTCYLVDYLIGKKSSEDIKLFYPESDSSKQIKTNTKVVLLNTKEHYILALRDNKQERLYYNSLLIATGSCVYIPEFLKHKQQELQGVYFFHTLEDIEKIKKYIFFQDVKRVAIVGTGLTGIECADALNTLGLDVILIEKQTHILSSTITYQAAQWLMQNSKLSALEIYTQQEIIACKSNKQGFITGLMLNSGKELQVDMLICALGTQANSSLALQAQIAVDNNGIVVDSFMKTSEHTIFAAGDCAAVTNKQIGIRVRNSTWADAVIQGIHAAYSMAGINKPYAGITRAYTSSFFETNVSIFGSCNLPIVSYDISAITYKALYLENNILKGFVLLGDTKEKDMLKRAVLKEQEIKNCF